MKALYFEGGRWTDGTDQLHPAKARALARASRVDLYAAVSPVNVRMAGRSRADVSRLWPQVLRFLGTVNPLLPEAVTIKVNRGRFETPFGCVEFRASMGRYRAFDASFGLVGDECVTSGGATAARNGWGLRWCLMPVALEDE